jgi:hypothetical protein
VNVSLGIFFHFNSASQAQAQKSFSEGDEMSDWSSKAAEQFKKDREAFQNKTEMFVRKERIKHEGGLALWNDLENALTTECTLFNRDMNGENILGFEKVKSDQFKVSGNFDPRKCALTVKYDQRAGSISHFMNEPDARSFGIKVDENGQAQYVSGPKETPFTPAEVSQEILNRLLVMQRPK